MSKITLNSVADITQSTTAQATINADLSTIQTAFDNTLSRDGTSPNQMTAPLDINSQQVLNLPQPATANSPLRLSDLNTFIGGGTVTNIPAGGITGSVLTKNSGTSYDVVWSTNPSDDAAGLNITLTGTNPVTIATVTNPTFAGGVTTPSLNNGGTLALPTSADTVLGRNTTDTLTNKSISGSTNTLSNIANASLTNSSITFAGTSVALGASGGHTSLTNSLGADVLLNNAANYFDGPSVAQGTTGTWYVSGTVTVVDTSAAPSLSAKLWDGTTVISSTMFGTAGAANSFYTLSISGIITSPAGNLRISVKDTTSTSGKILFNQSGNSKDSTITAIRIA